MHIAHYGPLTVAHDHGYYFLQTKDGSGAVFEGASGGVVTIQVCEWPNRAKFRQFLRISEIFFNIFTPTFFSEINPHLGTIRKDCFRCIWGLLGSILVSTFTFRFCCVAVTP